MAEEQTVKAGDQLEVVREGGRWLHGKPAAEEVKDWFEGQTLHAGMDHAPYLSGIVLIPQTEKFKVSRAKANGDPYEVELEAAAYTPYVKVETRISYFWDYVRALNDAGDDQYVGVIEPVQQKRITDPSSPFYNEMLPEGFSSFAVRTSFRNQSADQQSVTRFVIATYRVAIYERQSYAERLKGVDVLPVIAGEGTKQVPVNQRSGYADDASMMKAQTGAVGRALGFAGMLVVGTGVATAEDVQEAQGPGGGTVPQDAPALPPVVDREGQPIGPAVESAPQAAQQAQEAQSAPDAAPAQPEGDEALRDHALTLQKEMKEGYPDAWAAYVKWYTEDRKFPPLAQLEGPALKGAVTKLERDLDAVKQG